MSYSTGRDRDLLKPSSLSAEVSVASPFLPERIHSLFPLARRPMVSLQVLHMSVVIHLSALNLLFSYLLF